MPILSKDKWYKKISLPRLNEQTGEAVLTPFFQICQVYVLTNAIAWNYVSLYRMPYSNTEFKQY